MWFLGGCAPALLLLTSLRHASALEHDSINPAGIKPALIQGNAEELHRKPSLRKGVISAVQQQPSLGVSSTPPFPSAAAVASSSAITFLVVDLFLSRLRIGSFIGGSDSRSLALAHIERSTEPMSIEFQLELLKLSDHDRSLLTREEQRLVAKARAWFESELEAYYSLEKEVRRMRAAITAREQALRNFDLETATYDEVQKRRIQLKQMRKDLNSLKISLSHTLGELSRAQWDYRQDILSLNIKASAFEDGRWLNAQAARALAAQEKINMPQFLFPLELSREERKSVKRLVNEHSRLADEMRKVINTEGITKKLALEASSHLNDIEALLQELRVAGMKEEASTVAAKAVKLEVALKRSLTD
ncbi:hypothetical protein Emag_004316 [Eimeria magna]